MSFFLFCPHISYDRQEMEYLFKSAKVMLSGIKIPVQSRISTTSKIKKGKIMALKKNDAT